MNWPYPMTLLKCLSRVCVAYSWYRRHIVSIQLTFRFRACTGTILTCDNYAILRTMNRIPLSDVARRFLVSLGVNDCQVNRSFISMLALKCTGIDRGSCRYLSYFAPERNYCLGRNASDRSIYYVALFTGRFDFRTSIYAGRWVAVPQMWRWGRNVKLSQECALTIVTL